MGYEIYTSLEATLTMQALGEVEIESQYFRQVEISDTPIVVPDVVDGIQKVGRTTKISIGMLMSDRCFDEIMDHYKDITVRIYFVNVDGRSEYYLYEKMFADSRHTSLPEAGIVLQKYNLSRNVID